MIIIMCNDDDVCVLKRVSDSDNDIRFAACRHSTAGCSVIREHSRHDDVHLIVPLFDDFAMKKSRSYLKECAFLSD